MEDCLAIPRLRIQRKLFVTHMGKTRIRFWQALGTGLMIGLIMATAACGSSASNNGATTGSATTTGKGTSSTTGCTPGNVVVNGVSTEVFCGPAKAQASYQGQTFTWSSGACFNEMGLIGVNIGHEVLDPTNSAAGNTLKQKYDYFGAETTATADGTYANSTMAGWYHGQDITSFGTITLSNTLHAGSFTGKTILGGVTVTASWTC
jgi:hypothetical protein